MKNIMLLKADVKYWMLKPKEKKEICNGVGPKGLGWLFPETNWGLSMTPAANIHDYDYHVGKTEEDKIEADNNFLSNMKTLINTKHAESKTKWIWLLKRRLARAEIMYKCVDLVGSCAFNKKD